MIVDLGLDLCQTVIWEVIQHPVGRIRAVLPGDWQSNIFSLSALSMGAADWPSLQESFDLAGLERVSSTAMRSTAESTVLAQALVQAVDEGLMVPGEIVRAAIYERLGRSYQLRREEIPGKLETFHLAMQDFLGVAAKVMEKLIAKSFYSRLELNFTEYDGWTLIDYVNHAREAERDVSREGRRETISSI